MGNDPKVYEFKNINDITIYLNLMIELTIKHYSRYKDYFKELEDLYLNKISNITNLNIEEIKSSSLEALLENKEIFNKYINNRKNYKIKFYDFKSFEDKLNTPKLILANLIGDRSKNAVSYLGFRDRIDKFNKTFGDKKIELQELDENKKRILNDLNKSRNYEHHITDAKFIEWKNYREKQLQLFLQEMSTVVKWPSNEIVVDKYEFVEIEWLMQLYSANKNFKDNIETILQQMKKDYSKLIGENIQVTQKQKDILPLKTFEISLDGIRRHFGKLK